MFLEFKFDLNLKSLGVFIRNLLIPNLIPKNYWPKPKELSQNYYEKCYDKIINAVYLAMYLKTCLEKI